MKRIVCAMLMLAICVGAFSKVVNEWKPRVVIMTDIGPADVEPDDNESAVRLLAYADRFEVEAICTTIGWNCDPYPREWSVYLDRVVDAYSIDVMNLMQRSGQTGFKSLAEENGKQELGYWPSAEYIHSRTMMGSQRAGIGVIGEGNDSPGSRMLLRLVEEDDDRPIWVLSWGGSNTLAQALWRLKQKYSGEELKSRVQKFRIYTITDQDMQWSMRENREYSSHLWMRSEFKDLMFVWDESAWLNQNELGKKSWDKYAALIQNKGAMGKVYPTYKWGVEGDTPSFLHVMPNGLNDPNQPEQVGWGGYHIYALSPDGKTWSWTNWMQPQKDISDRYEKYFYPDEFNDFAARMQWADEGRGNRNPIVSVKMKKRGNKVVLDGSATTDPDGDNLTYRWWQQTEAGTYNKAVAIDNGDKPIATIVVPSDARGKTIHVVCEVHDDGPFHLVAYKRLVVEL